MQGHLRRDGLGREHKPYRYWLPSRDLQLLPEPPDLEPPEWPATLEEDLAFRKEVAKCNELRPLFSSED